VNDSDKSSDKVFPAALYAGTPQQVADQVMHYTRDGLLAFLAWHDTVCKKSRGYCHHERKNVIAYLCHCMGIRPADLIDVGSELAQYDRDCPGCAHIEAWSARAAFDAIGMKGGGQMT
jgi:hypothetical protein